MLGIAVLQANGALAIQCDTPHQQGIFRAAPVLQIGHGNGRIGRREDAAMGDRVGIDSDALALGLVAHRLGMMGAVTGLGVDGLRAVAVGHARLRRQLVDPIPRRIQPGGHQLAIPIDVVAERPLVDAVL
ncbi:hypothetical protein D3C72_1744470 [compost metagenome]